MRWRSPSYSPPRRGYRSPPSRGRYGRHREPPCGLLVRNIPKDSRPEEVRIPFEKYGRIRDVYLPKDFHTGEPRGFGFVQYLDPIDAAEAKRHMDGQIFRGREISVVFAEENRKRPEEMRVKERARGRTSYGGYRRSPYRGRSVSRSPPYYSPSPRGGHHYRFSNAPSRRKRHGSMSPSPSRNRSRSISPGDRRRRRDRSRSFTRSRSHSRSYSRSHSRSHSSSPSRSPSRLPRRTNGVPNRKARTQSASPEKSASPRSNGRAKSSDELANARSRSHSMESEQSPRSPRKHSRSRLKSQRKSRSPYSSSPPPRQRSASPASRPLDSRGSLEPATRSYSRSPDRTF